MYATKQQELTGKTMRMVCADIVFAVPRCVMLFALPLDATVALQMTADLVLGRLLGGGPLQALSGTTSAAATSQLPTPASRQHPPPG